MSGVQIKRGTCAGLSSESLVFRGLALVKKGFVFTVGRTPIDPDVAPQNPCATLYL